MNYKALSMSSWYLVTHFGGMNTKHHSMGSLRQNANQNQPYS